MKKFLTVINSVVATVINSALGGFDPLTLADGEVQKRYRLAPYGTYPVKMADGRVVQQVVDEQCADLLIASNESFRTKIASLGRGVPIYEGHADDPDWALKNPGHKTSAVGRIKSIEKGEDGIYVNAIFNDDGKAMLGGEAPKYSGHSPRWRMVEIPGRKDHYRPALLWSDALTNYPNLPGNNVALNALGLGEEPSPTEAAPAVDEPENEDTMKLTPDQLKRLGFAPDATPSADEILAAFFKVLDAADAKSKPEAPAATASNSQEMADLRAQLKTLTDARTADVVNSAITTGRIAEADKQKWTDALNTSFESESAKLMKLVPTVNTDAAPDLSKRRDEVDVINAATNVTDVVTKYAQDKGIDISTQAGWDRAYNGCRAAQPQHFKR